MLDLILLFSRIRFLRLFGHRVITDRFHWDNRIIYQEKYGDPGWLIQRLWKITRAIAGKPYVSFLLMIPPEESFRRVVARNQGVVEESMETLERRARLYASMVKDNLIVIDAMQPPESVFSQAWSHLESLIA
jgi:thymidylate kinase